MAQKRTKSLKLKKASVRLDGNRVNRKKLMSELVSIERESRLYSQILIDKQLKSDHAIVKAAKAALKLLANRQAEIFKALGI